MRVEDDAETLNRRRQRYALTSNVDTIEILCKSSPRDAELDSFRLGWVEREAVVQQPVVLRISTLLDCVDSRGPLLFVGENVTVHIISVLMVMCAE